MLRVLRQILDVLLTIKDDVRAIRIATEAIEAKLGPGVNEPVGIRWVAGTPERKP